MKKRVKFKKPSFSKQVKLFFQKIHNTKFTRIMRSLLLLTLAALLLTLTFNYFINPVGFYNGGFSGISQIIVYSIFSSPKEQAMWFYIVVLMLNIPFVIFGYFKVGRYFTVYTLFFMLMQTAWNFILRAIPILDQLKIMEELILPKDTDTGKAVMTLAAFIYAFIGSIIWGFAIAIAFIAGGSSGGSDFLAAYLAVWKKQGVGKFQKYMNYAIIVLAILIKYFVQKNEDNLIYAFFKNFTLYVSIIFATISTVVTNFIYPKFKLVNVMIFTKLPLDVCEYFKTHEYPHDTTLISSSDIKSGKVSGTIFATISLIEYKKVKYNVTRIDNKAFIVVIPVTMVYGTFNIQRFN
ncbi:MULTISPECIES: YitT family protein [unclassified Spiroplasma]|uniref:YitT family protein n=1 Tax=unclassified Spiroplasma TaxID=2637901 RepID=UPI0030D2B477